MEKQENYMQNYIENTIKKFYPKSFKSIITTLYNYNKIKNEETTRNGNN